MKTLDVVQVGLALDIDLAHRFGCADGEQALSPADLLAADEEEEDGEAEDP